ncbi:MULTISPECIES: hypothetical protein [unclassified Mesorhizobium]|uniref:hypothetical protein n=1 Tax=unclassified Mesorhizobium TaxID=325217 RepID=UPI0007FBF2EB|nr:MULTISPECIES: hypothetical protein [unclassified Mesorhizobium]OBQ81565.1 hypothetical protein A9K71_27155 [Mesorhizobium sp. WSM3873]PBB77582.1 hypothetical protein CK218_29605 [Mesorhizobium sp. WSM3879]
MRFGLKQHKRSLTVEQRPNHPASRDRCDQRAMRIALAPVVRHVKPVGHHRKKLFDLAQRPHA